MQNEKNSIVLPAGPFQKLCLENEIRMTKSIIDRLQELPTYLGLPSHTKNQNMQKKIGSGKHVRGLISASRT